MIQDWDDNEFPLAYLLTIRTFGTWLHGDGRGSVDTHGRNTYGTDHVAENKNLEQRMKDNMVNQMFLLNGKQRSVCKVAIKAMCEFRSYALIALNIRTNHAHMVISAAKKPELLLTALKSNMTRELRNAGLVTRDQTIWSRGGSRRYIWKPEQMERAVNYVLYCQGDELPDF